MENENLEADSSEEEVQYPEGGWGWVVCAGSFLASFIVFGVHNSFGVIYSTLIHELKLGEAESAWVGSMAGSLNFLCGPIVSYLCNRYGCRAVAFTGVISSFLGLFLTSFVQETAKMYLTYGLLWGVGSSFSFIPSIVVLGNYFHKGYPFAYGVASSGSGVGSLLAAPFINYILSRTGWQNSMRILAGVTILLGLSAFLYRPIRHPQRNTDANTENSQHRTSICRSAVWKSKPFVALVISVAMFQLCYPVPYVHLFEFAKKVGVSPTRGSWLLGILSITTTISKIFFARISQLRFLKSSRIHLLQLAIFIMGLATVLCPLITDYYGVLAYALVYGIFDGCFVCQLPVVLSDTVGHDKLTEALGNMFGVMAIPMSFGPPIAGWLYKAFDSYDGAFFVAGGFAIITSLTLFTVPYMKMKERTQPLEATEYIQPSTSIDTWQTRTVARVTYKRYLKSGAVIKMYARPSMLGEGGGGGEKDLTETLCDEKQDERETVL